MGQGSKGQECCCHLK